MTDVWIRTYESLTSSNVTRESCPEEEVEHKSHPCLPADRCFLKMGLFPFQLELGAGGSGWWDPQGRVVGHATSAWGRERELEDACRAMRQRVVDPKCTLY